MSITNQILFVVAIGLVIMGFYITYLATKKK